MQLFIERKSRNVRKIFSKFKNQARTQRTVCFSLKTERCKHLKLFNILNLFIIPVKIATFQNDSVQWLSLIKYSISKMSSASRRFPLVYWGGKIRSKRNGELGPIRKSNVPALRWLFECCRHLITKLRSAVFRRNPINTDRIKRR